MSKVYILYIAAGYISSVQMYELPIMFVQLRIVTYHILKINGALIFAVLIFG